jgi:coniferyl-aldehyde dehydrogenase
MMATKLADVSDVRISMSAALEKQRVAFAKELPVSAAARKDRISRAIALLVDDGEQFVESLRVDFGHRSPDQTRFTDIMSSVMPLKDARKHVDSWMQAEKRKVQFPLGLLGARARIEYQPKGVVGIISPWNFPVQLTFAPLAQIFAAGNRAMIKPSEFTPATSEVMRELFAKYFSPEEVAVFPGGSEVGAAFASLPFDHLIFTGATSVAHHIMRAAADNLVPLTLELGGKSPTIIGRSADVRQAAERIVMGKMLNAGQVCLAPDYLLVPADKEAQIVKELESAASRFYPNLLTNPDYTSVIDGRHQEQLNGYVADATDKGAKATIVNPAQEDFAAQATTHKMPLTLLQNVHDQMKVMQDEIFGPLLPVVPYDTIDQAIAYVNAHPRPLGLYYFGKDAAEQRQVLDRTISGGVTLNDVIFHITQEDLPFGGIGPAGMGAYHGHDGFKTFSHAKSIYTQPKLDIAKLVGNKPPYGPALQKTLKREIKK